MLTCKIPARSVNTMSIPYLCLKPQLRGKEYAGIQEDSETEETSEEQTYLLCRQCLAIITTHADRISVGGSHEHTFANPHGIVFEICCFRNARGCAAAGSPTNEFSWFAGYLWQVAVCGSCLTHIGWRFTSPDAPGFYGLIMDKLMESEIT
ncbi:MAG: cereblon family protein [Desulfosalsimonas sp.]